MTGWLLKARMSTRSARDQRKKTLLFLGMGCFCSSEWTVELVLLLYEYCFLFNFSRNFFFDLDHHVPPN